MKQEQAPQNKRPFQFFRRVKIGQENQEEIFKLPAGRAFLLRRVTIKAPTILEQTEPITAAPASLSPPSYVVMADPAGFPVPFEWDTATAACKAFNLLIEKVYPTTSPEIISLKLLAADVFDHASPTRDYFKITFPKLSGYGLPKSWTLGEPANSDIGIRFTVQGLNATTPWATAATPTIRMVL